MNDNEHLDAIKKRLEGNEYFVHPLSDVNVRQDIEFLFNLLQEKEKKIEDLEKKTKLLSQQVMELMQEIENVKGDFGDIR